jgi:hypothetical protein
MNAMLASTRQSERARVAIATEGAHLRSAILASERLLAEREARPCAQNNRIGDNTFVDDIHRLTQELSQNPYP